MAHSRPPHPSRRLSAAAQRAGDNTHLPASQAFQTWLFAEDLSPDRVPQSASEPFFAYIAPRAPEDIRRHLAEYYGGTIPVTRAPPSAKQNLDAHFKSLLIFTRAGIQPASSDSTWITTPTNCETCPPIPNRHPALRH